MDNQTIIIMIIIKITITIIIIIINEIIKMFMQKQIRDVRDTNIALPQSLTSRVSSFSVCVCHLPVYTVLTLKGLPAERAPTIKSTKWLSKSQIFD